MARRRGAKRAGDGGRTNVASVVKAIPNYWEGEHPQVRERSGAMDNRDRFDKFTERARKVLSLAQEEAQRFNHNYIGTEHLLLGLVREGDGVAAKVLRKLGVELKKGRRPVEFIIGRGDRIVPGGIRRPPLATHIV